MTLAASTTTPVTYSSRMPLQLRSAVMLWPTRSIQARNVTQLSFFRLLSGVRASSTSQSALFYSRPCSVNNGAMPFRKKPSGNSIST